MKFSNIYRMAKVERCVDCLVKEVIKIQFHPFPTAKNSYYRKHSNYQDCLHSATV